MEFSEGTKSRWAAYFGGATVVASLLLVAYEIRQNTVALSAQALQDLNSMANEIVLTAAENVQLSLILEKGKEDISSLSGAEYQQFWRYSYAVINSFDAAYSFYQKGILSEQDYSGWKTFTCRYLQDQSVREIWRRDKETFGIEFVEYVERECNL